jgi:hypothetical protein
MVIESRLNFKYRPKDHDLVVHIRSFLPTEARTVKQRGTGNKPNACTRCTKHEVELRSRVWSEARGCVMKVWQRFKRLGSWQLEFDVSG